LDTVVDGADFAEAWGKFVEQLRCRKDADWLTFDVGPTRHPEIEEGLDAPEDENWGAPFNTGE
jgi:hypothetical protein